MMKIYSVLIILYFLIIPLRVFATSTMYCECEKNEYLIRLHVNMDDSLADLSIFSKSRQLISLGSNKLDDVGLIWKNYEAPFTGNKLAISYKNLSDKMIFTIRVDGLRGVLDLNNKKYDIVCDWRR